MLDAMHHIVNGVIHIVEQLQFGTQFNQHNTRTTPEYNWCGRPILSPQKKPPTFTKTKEKKSFTNHKFIESHI